MNIQHVRPALRIKASEAEDSAALAAAFAEHHKAVEEALKKAAKGEDVAALKASLEETSARLFELEQKAARRGGGGGGFAAKTVGDSVVESEQYKAFLDNNMTGKQRISLKTLITSDSASAGALIPPDRQTDVALLPRRRLTVRDLMTPGRTTSNSIEFLRQLARTVAAATVAEGAEKQESALTFEDDDAPVRTIAHWIPVTKQAYADAPQLAAIINGELMYGLKLVEENQLLNGGGTGTDLEGAYTVATAYSAPMVPTAAGNLTKIDVLRLAILQATLAGYPATGIVMSPQDWADIEMTKDDTGKYMLGNVPANSPGQTLWRLPVVDSEAMSADTFLVGAFGLASQIFDRMDATILIADQHADYFIKNKLVVLCEERLALVNRRPSALVKGTFTAALAA